jgi:hypothetical protein
MRGWAVGLLCLASARMAAATPDGFASWPEVPEAERCPRMFAELGEAPRRVHLRSGVVRFVDLDPPRPGNRTGLGPGPRLRRQSV